MGNISIPTLITYIISLILILNIGIIIALYNKFKKLLPAIAYFFISISNALADNKITEEEWEEILSRARNIWDIITGTTTLLSTKNKDMKKFIPPPPPWKYRKGWSKF